MLFYKRVLVAPRDASCAEERKAKGKERDAAEEDVDDEFMVFGHEDVAWTGMWRGQMQLFTPLKLLSSLKRFTQLKLQTPLNCSSLATVHHSNDTSEDVAWTDTTVHLNNI